MIVNNGIYEFRPLANTGKALNMWGSTPANNVNVNLYTADGSNTQRWRVEAVTEGAGGTGTYLLHCMANEAYVLDRYRSSQNADIYTKATNATDKADQEVSFTNCGTYGNNLVYYITLGDGRRLAAVDTSNGTGTGKSTTSAGNVYFGGSNDQLQKWVAYPVSTGGGSTGDDTSHTGVLQRSTVCPTQTGTMYVSNIPDHQYSSGEEDNCLMHAGCGLPADFSGVKSTLDAQFDKFIQKVYPAGTTIGSGNRYYYLYGEAKDSSGTEYHPGVDVIGPSSCAIKALYGGEVTYSGGTYGTVSVYVPQLGITTNYVHLKNIAVSEGNTVQAGAIVGYQSYTGLSGGEHLHFEVRPARASGPEAPVKNAANALTTLMPYGYMDGEL